MSKNIFLVLTSVLVIQVAHGFVENGDYPTFAKCNEKIMSSIKTYWSLSGPPTNNLKKMEDSGRLIILHTSYNHSNENNKCLYIKVTGNIMNVTFIPKDGDSSANLTWIVEQGEDGVIRGHRLPGQTPEITWNWYTIFFADGIHVCYICSENAGSPQIPLADIMLAEGTTLSVLTSSAITNFLGLLKGWGIDFLYNYGSECFSKPPSSSTTTPSGGLLGYKPPGSGVLGSVL